MEFGPKTNINDVEQGDFEAKIDLATRYVLGKDIEKNEEKALSLLASCAKENFEEVSKELTEEEFKQAYNKNFIDGLILAAEQGNNEAQFDLAMMYSGGHFVQKDNEKALKYFTLCAEQMDAMTKK